jgi:hypothetical protein
LFGWLKRRKIREHAKLVIQTGFAAEVLADGWYSHDSQLSQSIKRRRVVVSEIARNFDQQDGLPSEIVEYLLNLNMELRRLHDAGPALAGEGFDRAYEPLLGYKEAIDRFLEPY